MKKSLEKDYLQTAITFSYTLPFDTTVKRVNDVVVKAVTVSCRPDYDDTLLLSYSLITQYSVIPFDKFDDTPLLKASTLTLDDLEMTVRVRITNGLRGKSALKLEESDLRAVCCYNVNPKVSGQENIRLIIVSVSPGDACYQAQTHLYLGTQDLGVIDNKGIIGFGLNTRRLIQRIDIIAEAVIENNFKMIVAQRIEKHNSSNK